MLQLPVRSRTSVSGILSCHLSFSILRSSAPGLPCPGSCLAISASLQYSEEAAYQVAAPSQLHLKVVWEVARRPFLPGGRSIAVALASACMAWIPVRSRTSMSGILSCHLSFSIHAAASRPLQDFRVRDPVLPSQLQYSAELRSRTSVSGILSCHLSFSILRSPFQDFRFQYPVLPAQL
ncbi:unnamed protein product [Schistocephalus solidus]|uniref:Secreted protein n=1 Tax=Schistocephalus solidus TaxID=70667 RepID=A0A183T5G5_SCHSO|nr:unnamed protein product [Schistocephalus solidus]